LALAGRGIAYKSIWDAQRDIEMGHLQTVLNDFVLGFQDSDNEKTGLQLVYPSRQYVPRQVAGFIDFFKSSLLERS
jgi:DNA-binding transcriptional LysR family regulator